uniref:Trk system potassium transporter TrkA n=1 Tax=Duncaniella muris TaxID=2094150 RepID=UPI0027351E5E
GEVGTHLAKLLSNEEQDITVVDSDGEKLAMLDANYNLLTFRGSPTSFTTLKQAGVEGCDLFIAVTPFETRNIVACAIAKSLELHNGELILVGVKLRDNAPLVGMQLKDLGVMDHNFHVAAIKRDHETIIPGGFDKLQCNDIVYFMTRRDHVDSLVDLCGKKQRKIRDVLIMGGSRIAIRLCAMASDEFNFKIMDIDRDRCLRLSERCPDAHIINADARDTDALLEAGISDMDAFIALADSSETNILTCLSAKELGVVKTIAEVENLQFISEAEGLNIGTIINKKLLASSRIFQMLLDRDTSTSKCLALADAEVAEIVAREGSKITRGQVKDLRLSRDMTIAGLIRDGKGQLVSGNTVIAPGDRVVVFTLNGLLHKVEKLFK